MFNVNVLTLTDCYNLSHYGMKKKEDIHEVSHIYNRTNAQLVHGFAEVARGILSEEVSYAMIHDAEEKAKKYGMPFPSELFERLIEDYDGKIANVIEIEVVEEDKYLVPKGTPFAQVKTKVAGFGELVTWFEGELLQTYFGSGVATRAYEAAKYLKHKCDGNMTRFHSFGYRGHRSLADAVISAKAWTTFLPGTDDFVASNFIADGHGSIPALAHKVVETFDDEYECMTHAIDYAASINAPAVSLVIDTYSAIGFIDNYVCKLAKYASEKGVYAVFRPDSGDLLKQTVAIYDKLEKSKLLGKAGVIIGADMSFEKAMHYDEYFKKLDIPLSFVAYGIGAGTYKDLERDTFGYAMKSAKYGDRPIMKFSEDKFKTSLPGEVELRVVGDTLVVYQADEEAKEGISIYKNVFDIPSVKKLVDPDDIVELKTLHLSDKTLKIMHEIAEKHNIEV